ncbi:MAG: hypothetical protein QNK33_10590 [Bacteroidales bacterium]|nr:hypothetical protein [Bacteroidales bacterium]
MKTLNGLWKGSYTFDPEFESDSLERHFEMTLNVDDEDEVNGEIRDKVPEDQTPRVAALNGFIDESKVHPEVITCSWSLENGK